MNAKVLGAIGVVLASGGMLVGILDKGGGDVNGTDGGVITEPVGPIATEAQICDKSVRATSGRLVRVVGVEVAKDALVIDTAIGKTVTVDTVPAEAICNVVFQASLKDKKLDVPENVLKAFGKASDPVKIGNDIYNALLKGDDCKLIGDLTGYLCSTLKDCMALPLEVQAKFLKVKGRCVVTMMDKTKVDADCSVPVGDPRAVDNVVFFPHNWSGREDLNIGMNEDKSL
jgi:hypothetical protein